MRMRLQRLRTGLGAVLGFFVELVNILERVIWGGPIMMASYLTDLVEGSLARP